MIVVSTFQIHFLHLIEFLMNSTSFKTQNQSFFPFVVKLKYFIFPFRSAIATFDARGLRSAIATFDTKALRIDFTLMV
jgi:hypothetical protein